ncbi:inhibitor of nuclear factor kappa B kinase subunit beta [Anticarsia gemmatalis]|uniref:inhibitor of nuclear factor kappa B kinase subunit beta n=1 Tax=Anticarsia gemmatalis TaxID=129554 RepID=UPI003F771EA2
MDDLVFIGDWIKERELGKGSFGTVVLWKHKRTDEKLAIKTCQWGDEMTEKHRERWTKEVEMLQNCKNPNIVGTKELPPEFITGLERANPSRLPILCMEYCSGGDLRQVLNKPESCSGLKEQQIRQILSDVGNAMQFLHVNKITHRDLKPENIVMNVLDSVQAASVGVQGQRKVVYKLIDLGYAKEIDSNSVCASLVGTLQYLAPEIIYSKTYSNSVDFWSFGLVVFELICGKRPFLPFMAPVQWMPYVKKKAHENICVYENFHGDVEYSNEIFPENYISKPFKALLEQWLQIALEWDPKLRGRVTPSRVTFNIPSEQREAASKIVIFDVLEKALAKKIVKIFSVATMSQLAYEIDDSTTIQMLKTKIFNDTKIQTDEQILITQVQFMEPPNEDWVTKYWNENIIFFLYSKSYIMKDNVEPIVPITVQRCLEHPKTMYNFKNSYNLYKDGLYFVMSQMELYDSLINGLFVRTESLKCEGKQLLLKHNSVDKNIGNLLAKQEILKQLVDTGKEHITNLRESSTGTNLLGGFDKAFKDSDDITERIGKLQNAWSQLTVRLQSATRRSNEAVTGEINNFVAKYNFQTVYTNAYKAFIAYKKAETMNRGREKQCQDIVKVCYDCLKLRSKILQEIRSQAFVMKLMDLSTEFNKISGIVSNAADNTTKLANDLNSVMKELTDCTWSTISMVVKDSDNYANIPYSVVSFEKKGFKIGEPVSNHCIKMNDLNKVQEDEVLRSLIEDSFKLRRNQMTLSMKLNSQKELLSKSLYDFSFLNDD